ncbi:MAG: phosphate ABC transporter permease subunit PstC [Roseiflexus sp.]|nr:phosphate ABC transporter permease subunit PstC [Roseiflexus sp.]MCS7288210.1 phosphate ABC transporter permease subunit PstC [Roseiflexus sp.]MDW8232846.1 phosphate ABC transporter permease subunit PstC [Roseiflexaceae bacterium]
MAQAQATRETFRERIAKRTQHGDGIFWGLTLSFALLVIVLVFAIVWVTWSDSQLARERFGWAFFTSGEWNPVETPVNPVSFGAMPAIVGTLVSSAIALILAAPVAIGIGIFLAELCPPVLRTPLSFMVELLAAIPSVIYGVWGVMVFAPFFTQNVAMPISQTIGQVVPWLGGDRVSSGRGLLIAGIILSIMILPTIAAITRDVLTLVPNSQREVLLALGATKWEVIWLAVVPYARAGIIGAVMLGLGRALGETMAATMLVGNRPQVPETLFEPATTAASLVASELVNAQTLIHESALVLIALALFAITLLLNLSARLLIWYMNRGPVGRTRA